MKLLQPCGGVEYENKIMHLDSSKDYILGSYIGLQWREKIEIGNCWALMGFHMKSFDILCDI